MSSKCDIAVIGGGAAGTAAAVALEQSGFSVCLIAPPAKFPPGRTAALLTGSVRFLHQIGAWASARKVATPLRAIRLVDATGRLVRAPEVTFHASEIGLKAFGYNVANRDLVEALAVAYDGNHVEKPVTSIEHKPCSALIRYDGGSIDAKLVIGADGARSLARTAAGITMRSKKYRQSALVTTLAVTFDHHNTSTEFHTANGPFTLVPLKGRRVSLVWMGRPDELAIAETMPEPEFNRKVEEMASSLLGQMTIDSERMVYPLHVGMADRFSASRTMLVGEAAHVFPPIGAQGLNLGFRDIEALCRVCRHHRGDPGAPGALTAYQSARYADIASRTASVDLLNRSLLTGFLPVQVMRGIGLTAAASLPPLKRFLMRQGLGAGRASGSRMA